MSKTRELIKFLDDTQEEMECEWGYRREDALLFEAIKNRLSELEKINAKEIAEWLEKKTKISDGFLKMKTELDGITVMCSKPFYKGFIWAMHNYEIITHDEWAKLEEMISKLETLERNCKSCRVKDISLKALTKGGM